MRVVERGISVALDDSYLFLAPRTKPVDSELAPNDAENGLDSHIYRYIATWFTTTSYVFIHVLAACRAIRPVERRRSTGGQKCRMENSIKLTYSFG